MQGGPRSRPMTMVQELSPALDSSAPGSTKSQYPSSPSSPSSPPSLTTTSQSQTAIKPTEPLPPLLDSKVHDPAQEQSQHCEREHEHEHIHHHHHENDSRFSVGSEHSNPAHQQYLDSLPVPDHDMVERIAEVQEHKEEEIMKKRLETEQSNLSDAEREKAAGLIQRNYRGHRERRMLAGMSLDPSARWVEAVKEARYRQLTEPRARAESLAQGGNAENGVRGDGEGGDAERPEHSRTVSAARMNWKKVGMITRRAGGDEDSDEEVSGDEDDTNLTPEEKDAIRKKKAAAKAVRQKAAKLMDLQYFLEMVDVKHRYGSNLRTYHEEWKKSETTENFFYWLDYGEGRLVDTIGCPRERLDKEQVRYLSKEERLHYLVKFDKEGRLCWAKNGARIDTTQRFKDSIHGIVPETDDTPAYRPAAAEAARTHSHNSSRARSNSESSSSSSSSDSDAEDQRADKYANPELDRAKGVKKIKHVSAATIFNQLLRGSVKKNTWIFVADTSFRLYVGIKQSGAFQHSSFLHGSRISAAGLIKIKKGRLAKLSPLSGHYRPPVSNFRAFVHSIKDEGVDMSHVSISRSYAVLVGLEAYVKTRRRGKKMLRKLIYHRDKVLSPVELAEKEEAERDKSKSAAKEKEFLAEKLRQQEAAQEADSTAAKIKEKLHITPSTTIRVETGETKSWEKDPDVQHPGTGPENAIAPQGTRSD